MSLLVVGALHWDVVVDAPRLPRLDETLMGSGVAYRLGGKGGNQALAAARAGARVRFTGRVGDDAPGRRMLEELAAGGVDVAGVAVGAGASGMSAAIVTADGEYGAVVVSGENRRLTAEAVAVPSDTQALLLQNELDPAVIAPLAARARAAGAEVILNAAPATGLGAAQLRACDVLIVNRVEARDLSGAAEPRAAHARLREIIPDAAILVTLGGDGVLYAAPGAPPRHAPAPAVEVRSTHGAGDVFAGTFAAWRLHGVPLDDAVAHAQTAAAAHVARR